MKNFFTKNRIKQNLVIDLKTNSLNGFPFGIDEKNLSKQFSPDRKIKYGQDTEFLYFNSGLCLSFNQKALESFMVFTDKSNRSNAYRKMQYNDITIKTMQKSSLLTNKTTKAQIEQIFNSPFERYISETDQCETFLYIFNSNHLIFKFSVDNFLTIIEYCLP